MFGSPFLVFKFIKKLILKNIQCLVTFQNVFFKNEIEKKYIKPKSEKIYNKYLTKIYKEITYKKITKHGSV